MKVAGDNNRFTWNKWFSLLVIIGIILSVWLIFFNYKNCKDKSCFDASLKACDKATFVNEGSIVFGYKINGRIGDRCSVDVKLLHGKLNNKDFLQLKGQSMTCLLPFGVVMAPEGDINMCHGLLKEGLQDLIIRKMHTYLVQNLGKLNLAIIGLPNVTSG